MAANMGDRLLVAIIERPKHYSPNTPNDIEKSAVMKSLGCDFVLWLARVFWEILTKRDMFGLPRNIF
jgi:hypothetical protein